MQHPETHQVTKTHGPRPAGQPDRCFYCNNLIGEEHKLHCVLRTRTVVLRVAFDIVQEVPEYWTQEKMEYHYGCRGHYCADNLLITINEQAKDTCSCDLHHATRYIREATLEDEVAWYGMPPDLEEK